MKLGVWVPGIPATKGSARAFIDRRNGQARVKSDNAGLARWEGIVATMVRIAMQKAGIRQAGEKREDAVIPEGPVELALVFHLPRPKAHFIGGDGRRLKATAPVLHDKMLDLDKLTRAVGDAIVRARFLGDDGQIARIEAEKRWADPQRGPGVSIRVEALAVQERAS